VASHLTVTTNAAGVSSSKSLNGSTSAGADEGAFDVFAALLGTAAPKTGTDAAKTSAANVDVNLGDLVKLSLGFGDGETQGNEDPEAIAAVVDAVVPFQEALDAGSGLAEIASTLADLQASLQAGEPLDPEMLKHLEVALSDLAEALDIDLDALPSVDDLTALVTDIQPDDTSFAARLTAAFGPLAETLFSGSAAPDAGEELSALLKSIGDKLAALLSALNSGEMEPDLLAQLELGAKADADTDLDAVLARLLKPAVAVDTDPATQPLATPELKLTEPALTGKASTDTPAPAESSEAPEVAPVKAAAETETGDSTDRGNDPAPPERKPVERPPIAAAVDKQPEAQASSQAAPAARVDIVAAPRVVQAGYQTSQQQLNLPQLAFEIVRQVNDGNTRFQIRLDPPELGRIDVKLDIDKAGQVHARLTVEKAETLDLMQRDQRGLERALQQAGLDGAKTNLEFSLKQNPFSSGGQHGQDGGSGNNPIFGDEMAAEADDTPPPTVNLYRGSLSASGVNIIA
jgi:flagellar hook-length control protein FliK